MSLDYLPEHVQAFARALEIAEREARALEASWHGLNQSGLVGLNSSSTRTLR